MNPYLKARREQYEAIRTQIAGIQELAVKEAPEGEQTRSLTEPEDKLVRSLDAQAKDLYSEIELLTAVEERNQKVTDLAGKLVEGDAFDQDGKLKISSRSLGFSNTSAKDRDPGHYRSVKEGGDRSFFGDIYQSSVLHDGAASTRLAEHNRALSTGTNGVGVVAPKWMTDEFELIARQGRKLANVVRNIPLGDDPRPITLPKQTAGTDTAVTEQAAENDPLADADTWDSDVDTVTPKATAGKQKISRQLLDMASPAIDVLIYGDLMEVYNTKVENKVGAGLITAAGTAVTTFATEAAFIANNGADAIDAVIDAEIAVLDGRKLPADVLAMRIRRWGAFKKFRDTTGRPLIPSGSSGPMNVVGVGEVQFPGQIEDLGVQYSEGIGTTAYPESMLAFKASDQVLFETNVLRFRYEEVAGPESIILGVWGYTAFISRQATKSVKRVVITASA